MIATITPIRAMKIMRELSAQNIPFSMKFISLNCADKTTKGIVEEDKVILVQGYRRNQSKKVDVLASFMRLETQERRQFYWPLLVELNGKKIKP